MVQILGRHILLRYIARFFIVVGGHIVATEFMMAGTYHRLVATDFLCGSVSSSSQQSLPANNIYFTRSCNKVFLFQKYDKLIIDAYVR